MTPLVSHRAFEPGTTGWTIEDLDDPEILGQWSEGRYELVEGVLTKMAPQGFESVDPLENLRRSIERYLDSTKASGQFYREVDLLLSSGRIARPDALFLTADQYHQQKRRSAERGWPRQRYHPVYVVPKLIIESLSIGHERHDRETKRRWYAEAGVPHYWLLTEHERSLVCLMLEGDRYVEEVTARDAETFTTSAFSGLQIKLGVIWGE